MTEPLVPVVSAPTQAMSLSSALRQASIDLPRDMPPGVYLSAKVTEQNGAGVVVLVRAKHVTGQVVWSKSYDGRGQAMSATVGVTW